MPLPITPYPVTTDEQLEELFLLAGEEALQVCIEADGRLWLFSEDDGGEFWAWSIPTDDPDLKEVIAVEQLWSKIRTKKFTVHALVRW